MIKLAHAFDVPLNVEQQFPYYSGFNALIPMGPQRAVAFGHYYEQTGIVPTSPHDQRFWFAAIGPDSVASGVTFHTLPLEVTQRYAQYVEQQLGFTNNSFRTPVPFRLGDQLGLLIGTDTVCLFASVDAQPQWVSITNGFATYGRPKFSTSKEDSYFTPERCGVASDDCVPVVLCSPEDRKGGGRHACLLQIDQAANTATWLHLLSDGSPRHTQLQEYTQFYSGDMAPGGLRMNASGDFVNDQPPLIYDCAWVDKHWHLYVAGFNNNYTRFGTSPALLTRNLVDLSLLNATYQPTEDSLGRICMSADRVIISPLHKNKERKGKQTIYRYTDQQEHAITLPKGYTKHVADNYDAGTYWLWPGIYDRKVITACTEVVK